jgi:hypothetical protein
MTASEHSGKRLLVDMRAPWRAGQGITKQRGEQTDASGPGKQRDQPNRRHDVPHAPCTTTSPIAIKAKPVTIRNNRPTQLCMNPTNPFIARLPPLAYFVLPARRSPIHHLRGCERYG